MLKKESNINLSGTSQVEINGTTQVIGYFSASVTENANVNTSASIANRELYEAYKETYKADRAEFDAYVDSIVDSNKEE